MTHQAPDAGEGTCGTRLVAEPLAHYLARTGRLPVLQGLALAVQLLFALQSLHLRGLAHGAITPGDLFVSRNGRLVLPPGKEGGPCTDPRTDLFAAAVVSYELLTGAAPCEVRRLDQDGVGRPETPPSVRVFRGELPLEVDAVFRRALAREPDHRYPTAAELSAALQAAIPGPHCTRSSAGNGHACADAQPAPAHPCATPPVARHVPQAQRPVEAGAAWHLGVAFTAWAVVTVLAATLVGGAHPPLPARHPGVPSELASGDLDVPPRPASQAVGLVDALRSAPLPDMGVDVAPAPTRFQPPAPVAPDIPAATPQHPRAASAHPQRTPPGADIHRPASRREPNGATASVGRVRPLQVAPPSPPSPRAACSSDLGIATELCTAFRCATAEFRQHPTCVRMHAEGAIARAQLAESRGGP